MSLELRVVWRYARLTDLRSARPLDLSAAERAELSHWRHPQRREGWLLARLLARRLIQAVGLAPAGEASSIEICSRDSLGRSVRPQVRINDCSADFSLSMSHTARGVLVALCARPGATVGVDLVENGTGTGGLVDGWFTEREQAELPVGDSWAASRVWAVKEAVYKASNQGDSFAPRQIEALRGANGDYACTYRGVDLTDRCRISLWTCDEQVAALAVSTTPTMSNTGAAGLQLASRENQHIAI